MEMTHRKKKFLAFELFGNFESDIIGNERYFVFKTEEMPSMVSGYASGINSEKDTNGMYLTENVFKANDGDLYAPLCMTESICSNKDKIHTIVSPFIGNNLDYNLKDIRKIGHRGNGENSSVNKLPIENTIPSFVLAHQKGAQMVELDVHLTLDNNLVVFHDHVIKEKSISKITYEEFVLLSQVEHDNGTFRFSTLGDILNAIPDELGVYVEIKYNSDQGPYPDNYPNNLVEQVLKLLENHTKRRFLIASFSPYICALTKAICPSYKVCLIISNNVYKEISKSKLSQTLEQFVISSGIDGIVSDTDFFPDIKDVFAKFENLDKLVYGKGTNDKDQIKELEKFGITGFCTDNLELYQ